MASVRVNDAPWQPLDNSTTDVAEPGRSYGGIGGGLGTLDLTLPLPEGTAQPGGNVLRFRFNRTDGVASGFRVLSFDFIPADGHGLLASENFVQDNPDAWQPPLDGEDARAAGKQLWYGGALVANGLPQAPPIRAHCGDCHAHDGRDLKYFNYSNASIVARSRFHGLTEMQGKQIASYIRALPLPHPGRPWNPPFQPGPGLARRPVGEWAAGAGLEQVVDDAATLRNLFGAEAGPMKITAGAFAPDGNLDPREVPIGMQLPDWNHWLPRVHPADAWGASFDESDAMRAYQTMRGTLSSPDAGRFVASGQIVKAFGNWVRARDTFLKPRVPEQSAGWTPALTNKAYSTQLWQLVKTWEIEQEFGLESRARELRGGTGPASAWLNTIPAATAPAALKIPDGPTGMGNSALVNEYFNNAWYELQVQLDGSDHGRDPDLRIDWVYLIAHHLELQRLSNHPEPGRVLLAVMRAMQSTDPRLGPDDPHGWRPNRNVDPRILVDPEWAATFAPLSAEERRGITESLLTAWLEKNQSYQVGRYFDHFFNERRYELPAGVGVISGGRVWDAAPLFAAAGVRPTLIRRLRQWGNAYDAMAKRFQY
jgi:hypothetical protein